MIALLHIFKKGNQKLFNLDTFGIQVLSKKDD